MAGFSQTQTLSQQQVLAPQLQQSLQILQVPMLELRNLIQQEIQTKGVWMRPSQYGDGAPYPITINYFAWIDLDAESQKISFEGPTGTATVPLSGLRGEDVEYSFFVFPESGWGSLDGTYDFEIESRLD